MIMIEILIIKISNSDIYIVSNSKNNDKDTTINNDSNEISNYNINDDNDGSEKSILISLFS